MCGWSTWFATIAVVPAILVAIFAAVTLNLGLEAWFSGRVKDALGNAVNVAQHYVHENMSAASSATPARSPTASSTTAACSTRTTTSRSRLMFAKLAITDQGSRTAAPPSSSTATATCSRARPSCKYPTALKPPPPPTSPMPGPARSSSMTIPRRRHGARADPAAGAERRLSAGGARGRSARCSAITSRTNGARVANITGWTQNRLRSAAGLRRALCRGVAGHPAGRDLVGPVGRQPAGAADLRT